MTAKLSVRDRFTKALEIFEPSEIEKIEKIQGVVAKAMEAIDEAKCCAPDIDAASYKDAVLEGALRSIQMTRIALRDAHRRDVPPGLADSLINTIAVAQAALLKRFEFKRPDEGSALTKGDTRPCFELAG